jgi:hypothetical protein
MVPSLVVGFDAFLAFYDRKFQERQQSSFPKAPFHTPEAPSSPIQQQPKAPSTLTPNAPTISPSRPKTPSLDPNAPSFSPSSRANSRSVSPSSSVSSAAFVSSRPTRSWWTLAEDSAGGCEQFLGFHREKPRAGKFYCPVLSKRLAENSSR